MRKYNELYLWPRCGDMWLLTAINRYALVDFVDYFVGITLDNGMRIGFPRRTDFEYFVKKNEGANVQRWEDGHYIQCDIDGFNDKPISKEVAASYIAEQITTLNGHYDAGR